MNIQLSNNSSQRSRSNRIQKRHLHKQLKQKQNGFVLDCLNQQRTKLQTYNSTSDKFLHYFIIRVHPKYNKNGAKKIKPVSGKQTARLKEAEELSHDRFQEMINKQKLITLNRSNETKELVLNQSQQPNLCNNKQQKYRHKQTNVIKENMLSKELDNVPEDNLIKEIQSSIKYKNLSSRQQSLQRMQSSQQ